MKTKLLLVFLSVLTLSNTLAQTETTDYTSGLIDPVRMEVIGTDIYVQGFENLYKINTNASTPSATVIYTPPTDFFIGNICSNGSTLYMVQENYIVATDTYVGSRIVALDLNHLATPVTEIYSTSEYISSLTSSGNTIYFSAETLVNPPNFDPFYTHIDKIDVTQSNPTPVTVVANLTDNGVAADMVLHNDLLLISVRDDQKIYQIDITQTTPAINTYLDGLSFPKGIFKTATDLYITDGNEVKKVAINNPNAGTSNIAINTTYQDSNSGTPYNANFKDVVLLNNTVYTTLESQGKVMQAIDATLSINENYLNKNINIYPNPLESELTITVSNNITVNRIIINNLLGQEVLSSTYSSNINLSNLPKGIYLATLKTNKGSITKKIIKK